MTAFCENTRLITSYAASRSSSHETDFSNPSSSNSSLFSLARKELEMSDRTDIIQKETAFSTKKTNFVFIVNSPKEDQLKLRIRWQEALEHTLQTAM